MPVKSSHLPLVALCLGFFMVIVDATIVNVALPSISKNLQGDISWLQWVLDGYTLTFACLLLSAGHFADRIGAKAAFIAGQILFVVTSIGCGLSLNFWQLIIFRLLQGASAALLVPTSLALIQACYETKEARASAIGIWAAMGAIAGAAGPILGGILTAWAGWRSIFFVNVPIGLAGALLTLKYVPGPRGNAGGGFDLLGQLFGIVSIAALAFSLIEAGRFGWYSHIVVMGFFIFTLCFFLFLLVEHKTPYPMLSLKFFKSKTFSVAIAIGMILNIGGYGQLFVLTLYFQQIRHYSVFISGFAFLPLLGTVAVIAYFGGKLTRNQGAKLPMMIGLVMGAIGFLTLLFTNEKTPYFMLILPLAAIGFGIALTMPAATIAAIHSAPSNKAGIASGTLNASRQIGSLIGVAVFGTIINMAQHFIYGMKITLFISGLAYAAGAIAVLIFIQEEM